MSFLKTFFFNDIKKWHSAAARRCTVLSLHLLDTGHTWTWSLWVRIWQWLPSRAATFTLHLKRKPHLLNRVSQHVLENSSQTQSTRTSSLLSNTLRLWFYLESIAVHFIRWQSGKYILYYYKIETSPWATIWHIWHIYMYCYTCSSMCAVLTFK